MHIQVYLYFEAASATSNSCGQCDVEFLKKRLGIEVEMLMRIKYTQPEGTNVHAGQREGGGALVFKFSR